MNTTETTTTTTEQATPEVLSTYEVIVTDGDNRDSVYSGTSLEDASEAWDLYVNCFDDQQVTFLRDGQPFTPTDAPQANAIPVEDGIFD